MEPLDIRIYRAAMWLYPPAFRREFSPQMVHDFENARQDPEITGSAHGLWALRARMIVDLARTVVLQWFRSGWPVILGVSMVGPLLAVAALASLWRRAHFVLPTGTPDADVIALVLLAATLVIVIAATIILTLWFAHPLTRRHRR